MTIEERIGYRSENRALVRLATLLSADRSQVKTVADRLRLSTVERHHLVSLLDPPIEMTSLAEERGRRYAFVTMHNVSLLCDLVLFAAATGVSSQLMDHPESIVKLTQRWQNVHFPLTGKDVLAAGIPSGPKVGALLKSVMYWWAEHDFQPDRPSCLLKLLQSIE